MRRTAIIANCESNPDAVDNSAVDARRYAVANALASSSIEGFVPSSELKQQLERYIAGSATTEQLVEEIKARYKMHSSSSPGDRP